MKFTELEPSLHICGQITPADIKTAADMGIRTIINLRPEGEKNGEYITAKDASQIASGQGLNYCHIPVIPDQITEQNVADFSKILAELPGPVLAHCGTGKRVAMLWALSTSGSRPAEKIIAQAAAAGHDIFALKPKLG